MDFLILSWLYPAKRFTLTWVTWVNSNLIKYYNYQKHVSEVWIYWAYNQIYALGINAPNDLGWRGMEPALQSSAQELNRSALTDQIQKLSCELNSRMCIERRSSGVITRQTIKNKVKTQVSIAYIQIKFDEIQNDYLTQKLAI